MPGGSCNLDKGDAVNNCREYFSTALLTRNNDCKSTSPIILVGHSPFKCRKPGQRISGMSGWTQHPHVSSNIGRVVAQRRDASSSYHVSLTFRVNKADVHALYRVKFDR